jgi:hypothetical protein
MTGAPPSTSSLSPEMLRIIHGGPELPEHEKLKALDSSLNK